MALNVGSRLGHYDVTALLGEGGMGQVYRATDTQLHRDVALKILPDAFADDPDRLARFQREAQVLASLNHPNIAQIHGIEEAEGTRALVLELVEGPTLADWIAKGPIPIDEALPIAKQIAEALEAAHEAGVIHRDLKPANIKVREDGTVKVLDFGLAKALDPSPTGDPSQSPTLTAAATQMGIVMGTAAYMSPEQARGKPVDKRSDIWSFGAVLYEMLSGRRPFEGRDVSEVLGAVLQLAPDWDGLPLATPPRLTTLLRRCLEKEPKQRIHDMADARLAMEGAFETTASTPSDPVIVPPLQVWQRPMPLVIAGLLVAVVSSLIVWGLTRPAPTEPRDLMRFAIVLPDTAPLGPGSLARNLAISPDGTQIVYWSPGSGGDSQLHLRPIDQLVGGPLRGSEGAYGPFFSPDGEWVGFTDATGTLLQKVSIFGGPPVTLTEAPTAIAGKSWTADDQIIFGAGVGLFRVSGGGGQPETLTTPDADEIHGWPFVIPGRDAVLFTIATGGAFLATGQLAVLDLDSGDVTPLGLAGVSPHYVSTGHLVYAAQDGSVRAVPFDAPSLEVTGNPVPLVEGIEVPAFGSANFDLSDNGRLVYALGTGSVGVPSSLVWVDRDGREEPLAGTQPDLYVYPRISPDGARVAVAVADPAGDTDLWVLDPARGSRARITFGGDNRFFPVWSPDGSQLAFADGGGRTNRVLLAAADGSGQVETLLDRDERQFPTSWAPDGSALAIYTDHPETARDLGVLPMDGDRTPVPFLATPFQERAGAFSPDGHWLAYVSDESGRDEVYVRPYPGPGQEHTISTDGGEEPVWSRDGRELFYRNGDQMYVVAIDAAESFRAASPELLFVGTYDSDTFATTGATNYDIAPNGQRLLMLRRSDTTVDARPQITVVLNWLEELKARAPVP